VVIGREGIKECGGRMMLSMDTQHGCCKARVGDGAIYRFIERERTQSVGIKISTNYAFLPVGGHANLYWLNAWCSRWMAWGGHGGGGDMRLGSKWPGQVSVLPT